MIQTYTKMEAPKNRHFLLAKNLEEIVIANQRFQELSAQVFEGANKVQTIRLDNSEINTLDENAFLELRELETLSLSSNEIETIPSSIFATLQGLKMLDMSSNMIKSIPRDLFDTNRFLTRINFSHNRFLRIHHINMGDKVDFDFTDSICINAVYGKTTTLNDYTALKCDVDKHPKELVASYRDQNEINQICQDKNMLVKQKKILDEKEKQKRQLLKEKEAIEHNIMKMKIYKNSLC